MSSQYRFCHNCGAPLAPGETHCPNCGAPYDEPSVQKPGEFDPFQTEEMSSSEQTEPYVVQPQQPVVLPPVPQQQAPYLPQSQGYIPPNAPSPYAPGGYGQQMPGQVGGPPQMPGQVGGPPQPPESETKQGLSISLIIGLAVAAVLLLILVGGIFYILGQRNTTTPGTTPTPGVTPTPTPTHTPTPGTTPTPTPTSVPFQVTTIDLTVNPLTIAGKNCGTQQTITYTATFNVHPKGPGGAVQFTYTTDGGLTRNTQVVQFNAGQTSKQFQFTASGTLAPNGAFPGAGQVTTTSPNSISSQAVTPQGTCTPVSPTP